VTIRESCALQQLEHTNNAPKRRATGNLYRLAIRQSADWGAFTMIDINRRYGTFVIGVAIAAFACGASAVGFSESAETLVYRDPGNRFVFSYPRSFGTTSVGTDNGFENRVAAIRFSVFSTSGLGGEAVLGRGHVSLDVQAAGGLYDDLLRGTLPQAMLSAVDTVLPPLTRGNFCDQIGREKHVNVSDPAFAALPEAHRAAVASLDAMGNIAPRVIRCRISDETVTFDKEAGTVPNGRRRRVYGAVRFMEGDYSAFQLIRAAAPVDEAVLEEMRSVVRSWRVP
jgi:hypothetical protein